MVGKKRQTLVQQALIKAYLYIIYVGFAQENKKVKAKKNLVMGKFFKAVTKFDNYITSIKLSSWKGLS